MEEKKKAEAKEEKNIKKDERKQNDSEEKEIKENKSTLKAEKASDENAKVVKPGEENTKEENASKEIKSNFKFVKPGEENEKEENASKESKSNFKVVKPEEENLKDENASKESKSNFKVVKSGEENSKDVNSSKDDKKSENKENKKSEGKSKEKKSKKKGNGGKVFLVILLILILAIIIHYVKNQMIFAKIYNTAKDYVSIENYEVKREITGTDINNTTDAKYLNGLYKVTLTQSNNAKVTMVTMQNKVAIFTEKDGVKTVRFSDKDNVNLNGIIVLENRTFTSNEWYNNFCSKICTKNEDGKEYYVVSGFNSNMMPMVGNHAEVYINKENGLIEKIVETGKDGNEVQTTTYKYEFNNVKTTDLGIPDITSYKLAE